MGMFHSMAPTKLASWNYGRAEPVAGVLFIFISEISLQTCALVPSATQACTAPDPPLCSKPGQDLIRDNDNTSQKDHASSSSAEPTSRSIPPQSSSTSGLRPNLRKKLFIMQVSPSLADFMAKLQEGPRGAEDAAAAIEKCASEASPVLDLQQMYLTNEDMQAIASKFSTVASHVTTLNLFMNEITVLPSAIATFSNLEVLSAGCNPLEHVDAALLQGLPNLRELDVGFSEILSELPDAFGSCRSLKVLYAGNGCLEKLPPSLFRCEELEELHLYGNSLKVIGEHLGKLRNLRILSVGRNQIRSLPKSIADCTALETLHAYENCLTHMPPGLGNLKRLKTFNVSSNADLPMPPRDVRCQPGVAAMTAFYANGATN